MKEAEQRRYQAGLATAHAAAKADFLAGADVQVYAVENGVPCSRVACGEVLEAY